MPRAPRQEHEGAIYHVFARGVNRMRTFVDAEDYSRYLGLLAAAVERHGWRCLAYCLMPNHVHLLIETPRPNLGTGIQYIHGQYAQLFNERHSRVGHLFQGRYRAELIGEEAYMAAVVPYIAMNPVAAGLSTEPKDWPWSSHFLVDSGVVPDWLAHERLLELLDDTAIGTRYDRLIEARLELTTDRTLD